MKRSCSGFVVWYTAMDLVAIFLMLGVMAMGNEPGLESGEQLAAKQSTYVYGNAVGICFSAESKQIGVAAR